MDLLREYDDQIRAAIDEWLSGNHGNFSIRREWIPAEMIEWVHEAAKVGAATIIEDKVEGLLSDINDAVEVAWKRAARDLLHDVMSSTEKVGALDAFIRDLMAKHDHMSIIEDVTPHGQKVLMWEVCDRKMHYTMSIKNAHDVMKKVVDEYGRRALMAETQKGADWKALSHAVRVSEEALELLQTGRITFPLPNAAHILDIKLGRLPYEEVTEEIEDLLVKVEAAAEASTLPDKPDYEWIDDFVTAVYRDEVLAT